MTSLDGHQSLIIDIEQRSARLNGRLLDIQLSRTEATLLAVLSEHAGEVCHLDTIGAAVWGVTEIDNSAIPRWEPPMIHTMVSRLRHKLERAIGQTDLIRNVRGTGYRLTLARYEPASDATRPRQSLDRLRWAGLASGGLAAIALVLLTVVLRPSGNLPGPVDLDDVLDESVTAGIEALTDNFTDPLVGLLAFSWLETDDVRAGYRDGCCYDIGLRSSEDVTWAAVPVRGQYSDMTLAVEARVDLDDGERWLAIGCRNLAEEEQMTGYRLKVDTVRGELELGRFLYDGSLDVLAQASSPAIKRGTALNHIEITCRGYEVTARVNDVVLIRVADEWMPPGGSFWIGVGAAQAGIDVLATYESLSLASR